eukprot:11480559-Prorocentrum_lima.AAC.1
MLLRSGVPDDTRLSAVAWIVDLEREEVLVVVSEDNVSVGIGASLGLIVSQWSTIRLVPPAFTPGGAKWGEGG